MNYSYLVVILFIYISKLTKVSAYVNVALKRPAYLSSTFSNKDATYNASYGVDGIIAPGNMTHSNGSYPNSNWFVVDLVYLYQVKYVVLYDRSDVREYSYRLNNFMVGLTNNFDPNVNPPIRGNYDVCGQWPQIDALLFPQPMRVNCNDENKFSRYVIIQQSQTIENTDKNLGFAELEVYSDVQYSNIALFKPAYMSSVLGGYTPNLCVDGKNDNLCHLNDEIASMPNWFAVDLLQKYRVQFVVLYNRVDCCYDRMDKFIVGLTNNFDPKVNTTIRGNYELCGQWPAAALSGGQSMKVDCANKNIYSRYVVIQQDEKHTAPLELAELEVYAPENIIEKYFGCFKRFQTLKWYNESSIESCLKFCDISNMNFSAMKNKTQCHCGTPSGASLPSSQCIPTCDAQGVCVGFDTYAVFKVKPVSTSSLYVGCYVDSSDRDLGYIQVFQGTSTIEMCLRYCSQNNFVYAALQYSYYCLCGYSYGKYGKAPESDCNNKCDGNQTQICGGGWRNSVYFLFDAYGTKKSCSEIYNCANETIPIPVIGCESGKCEPGWKGKACDKRDCRTNNGDCGIHQCMDYNMGTMNLSECVCKDGYQKSYFNDDCIDIDECSTNIHKCNLIISNCSNTNGSYECRCFKGFEHKSGDKIICEDVNECSNVNANNCTTPSETCINTFGSYICNCSSGYERNNTSCIDIDECLRSTDNCSKNVSSCINTPRSFNCPCLSNYEISNNGCILISRTGAIVGGVLGTIAILLLIAVILGLLVHFRVIKMPCITFITSSVKKRTDSNFSNNDDIYNKIENIDDGTTTIQIENVERYYNANKEVISKQFEDCPKGSGESMEYGDRKVLIPKNRFKNHYPYDHNRVNIEPIRGVEFSDYINASFVQAYPGVDSYTFIAAQGPKEKSVEDFWRMVCEHDVNVIVMLTRCHEEDSPKCVQYWPDVDEQSYGSVTVKIVKITKTLYYELRIFYVDSSSLKNHKVCHLLYTAWIDKSVPKNVASLWNLREKMLSFIDLGKKNTIVVHCSAGVGRTGTFIALDYLLNQAKRTGKVDMFECMKRLRDQRYNMIQANTQYELCFRALILFHNIGKCTYISTEDKEKCLKQLNELKKKTNEKLKNQFKMIEKEIKAIDIKSKRGPSIKLSTGTLDAVYASSSARKKAFVMGRMPKSMKGEDLFTLFKEKIDVVIFLDVERSKNDVFLSFLPARNQPMTVKEGFMKMLKHEEMANNINWYDLEIFQDTHHAYSNTGVDNSTEQIYENTKPTNTFIHVTSSNGQEPWPYDVMRSIYGKMVVNSEKSIAVLGNDDGYDDPAYMVAGLNLMQMMDEEDEIDIYRIVFQLKSEQPRCFIYDKFYQGLHMLAETHLTMSERRVSSRPRNLALVHSSRETMWGQNTAANSPADDGGGAAQEGESHTYANF